jgi:hypothetical protein
MIRIKCKTLFDITLTGVTGRFRPSVLPFVDRSGCKIDTQDKWNYARNQQRNLETLIQLISLRSQPLNLTDPIKREEYYEFTFDVETVDAYLDNNDELFLLRRDCEGVPMLVNLDEFEKIDSVLCCIGQRPNVWFERISE